MSFSVDNTTTSFPHLRDLIRALPEKICTYLLIGILTLLIFYLSLITTSQPLSSSESQSVARAISLLEQKGFRGEAFLLRNVATFRRWDNWLNELAESENAYAATNFPFEIITLYPDFFEKAVDDTERAMILLHEAQHLKGASEKTAYETVWRNRTKLGWTLISHGVTETYVTIELQTREHSPELFTCSKNLWNDCTESLLARK
ncbi:MAG: hypothetical protein HKN25_15790 [Pyrinomonadaceae bacterium]|nr:hypothetical protein [Pyrinomonadaceae bacterium]